MPSPSALEQIERSRSFETVDGSVELAGFRGKLQEIGLPSLLSILETERGTGMLVLTPESAQGKAHLHLSEGRVLRARWDNREEPRNAELVYDLIAGLRGTFDFHPSKVTLDDEIQCSATRLLFEGVRRISQMREVPDARRRFIPLKAAIAVLAMAAFVSVVLAAPFFSDPGAPEALRYLPADPPTTFDRSEGRSGR